MVLKILILVCLPVPLLLWLPFGVLGSLLLGVGYGFFVPLIATFEATGENTIEKLSHYFLVIVFDKLLQFFKKKIYLISYF